MTDLEENERRLTDDLFRLWPHLGLDAWESLLDAFKVLRAQYLIVANIHDRVHQGQLVMIGAVNHSYNLFLGGLAAARDGNSHVWSACLRGLIETFGLLAYIERYPNKVSSVFDHGIPAGKFRSAADGLESGLGEDIDRLSKIVHPGKGAMYAGIRIKDLASRHVVFSLGPITLTSSEAAEAIADLLNVCCLITEQVRKILETLPSILSQGEFVMERHDTDAADPAALV